MAGAKFYGRRVGLFRFLWVPLPKKGDTACSCQQGALRV